MSANEKAAGRANVQAAQHSVSPAQYNPAIGHAPMAYLNAMQAAQAAEQAAYDRLHTLVDGLKYRHANALLHAASEYAAARVRVAQTQGGAA